jgi:hypothetical protein
MTRERIGYRTSVTLLAALVVLAVGISQSRTPPIRVALRPPETPVDHVSPAYARCWRFLKEARKYVPEGSSYTVLASTPDEEMLLFMLSLGIFERHRAIPTSYWGSHIELGSRARYVLAVARPLSGEADWRLVARIGDGGVWSRPGGD